MNNKTLKIWVLTLVGGILFVPAVYASGSMPKEKSHQDLNLTEPQRKAFEGNKLQYQTQTSSLFQVMQERMTVLHQELQKDEPDMSGIDQIQKEIKLAQSQMADAKLEHILRVKKILTPEQFKKFMGHMEEYKGKHKHSSYKMKENCRK